MIYTTYNPITGEITGQVSFTEGFPFVDLTDKTYIEGKVDPRQSYIDITTKNIVEKPRDPSGPWTKYNFNWDSKSWEFDSNQSAVLQRELRNDLLLVVDRVNPIWYDSLTLEQKTELQQYRQALLDVTTQTGFPLTIQWPQKPTWL